MRIPGTGSNRPVRAAIATLLLAGVAAFVVVASAAGHTSRHASPPAKTALDWNTIAVSTVRAAAPAKFQLEGLIYVSYVQAAVYDAVTKIEGRYKPYHNFHAPSHTDGASADAAVAAAAYTTLAYYFPAQASTLATTYATYLVGLPAAGKDAGVAIGNAAAADIIALRTGDGRDAPVSTPYGQGPLTAGVWIFAPSPSLQSAQTPWAAFMQPFMLKSTSQFRAGPPLVLQSHEYQVQFEELRAFGSVNSPVRTAEETAVGQFWNANAISQGNQTLRDLATAHGFDLVDTARALAMGNLVDADSGMACWDSKYHYTFWRPVTAIQHADIDGNPGTTADPAWTPLITTPNHPEYPAAHGCLTAADGEVYANLLGTTDINVDIPGAIGGATTLMTTRHYATVSDLDTQIVDARVWAGLHFRYSGEAGVKIGISVADWALKHYFKPTGDGD
jgi:hypothetical protein